MKGAPPLWIATVVLITGVLFTAFGGLCWTVPHLLFSSEGYRTVSRAVIGILGAMSMGVGLCTLLALCTRDLAAMLACLRITVFVLASGPAIAFFNLGAVEPLRFVTGINIFLLVGINLILLLLPASLALLGLRKLHIMTVSDREPHDG